MGIYKLVILVILAAYLFVIAVGLFRKLILKGWLGLFGPGNPEVRRQVERRMLEGTRKRKKTGAREDASTR